MAIPLDYELEDNFLVRDKINNVSAGGVCFCADIYIKPGSSLCIRIPVQKPPFEAKARVVWCQPANDKYDVGVRFDSDETAFAARMVEQICHIADYKKTVATNEGRQLTDEQAAQEWIEKFAHQFPRL